MIDANVPLPDIRNNQIEFRSPEEENRGIEISVGEKPGESGTDNRREPALT